jgi:acetaldehyde dehydrogenase/alcohol dehydrogenase
MDPKQQADQIMEKACLAAAVFNQYDQAQTDRIVEAVFRVGFDHRVELAQLAHEETKLGVWQDKVFKNVLATQFVYQDIKDEKTVGVISHDERSGITEIAQPLGPVFAITPITNPTSTCLYKILICLKTRNPIIISPHRRSLKCCVRTVELCYQAALAADAPEDCIQIVTQGSRDLSQALMSHPKMALILATGGTGLVTAAYSSGTPAIGVGPGNVPVFIDRSADIAFAVGSIVTSKTFDNGTVCASEQAVVVEEAIAAKVVREFEKQGCCFLTQEQIPKVEKVAIDGATGGMSPEVVGQSAMTIAELAGIDVPAGTRILMVPLTRVGPEVPLSGEVLAPILGFYVEKTYQDAVKTCIALNYRGGIGHTAACYANDERRIEEFAEVMNAGRVLVNTPSSQGAVGAFYNTLRASLTLGCGSGGKNSTTENISAVHLYNIKRICRPRPDARWLRMDHAAYLDKDVSGESLWRRYHSND